MANLKEIRFRIGSVKNTRKITQAMSRIAAARLSRAQNAMERAREYGKHMRSVVGAASGEIDDPTSAHPLMEARAEVKAEAIILVTSDRGLCGGFNTNASRLAVRALHDAKREGREVVAICVGKKGQSFLKHRGFATALSLPAPTSETVVSTSREVMAFIAGLFNGEDKDHPKVDRVHLAFNRFKNVITQEAVVELVLPVKPELEEVGEGGQAVRKFEPDVETLLNHLVPVSVATQLQQAFFNSAAAELAARRLAMDSATDNAGDLIKELTLIYNRERQAAITKELMEIVGGAEALKG